MGNRLSRIYTRTGDDGTTGLGDGTRVSKDHARVEAYGVHIDRLGIGRIESGKRIVLDFELRAIAAALYVPVSWLIGEEEVWGAPEDIPERPRIALPKDRRPGQE